jgi:hypothetical protein
MRRLVLALVLSAPCSAQSPPGPETGPEWVAEQYFFAPAWPRKAEYYTGEMRVRQGEKTIGEAGVPALRTSLRPVETTPATSVYAVQAVLNGRVHDLYAYVVKEEAGWRLAAIRALWLPPMYYMLLDTLASTPTLPDSDAAELENMRLTVSTDSALKAFFEAHHPVLDSIAEVFGRDTTRLVRAVRPGAAASTSPRSPATQLAELHFGGARRDPGAPGCVLLAIGGMLDNEVGFMHCPDTATPPAMSIASFILVEAVAPGWYLYKTT